MPPAGRLGPRTAVVLLTLATAVEAQQGPPAPVPMEALARESLRILEQRCFRCHGGERQSGDLRSVRSVDAMVRGGFIQRGQPDSSELIQRLAPQGDMPLGGEAIPEVERETLRRWIRAGAPIADAAPTPTTRPRVDEAAVAQAVLDDLGALPETARPFARYFTLHHLHNTALSDPQWPQQRQSAEDALAVLLNSLSWQRALHRLVALRDGLVLRVDLRRLGWSPERWDLLTRHYPYAARSAGEVQLRVASAMGRPDGAVVPWVRCDWFVAAASASPLYESLLDLPATRAELERFLRVDVAANLRQFTAARAGFRQSGVSRNNRVIERHDTPFGAYWQSYDFADNVGRHDVFLHPLGPGTRDGEFDPSGGEIIFTLPNGLQGYLLVDAAGRRIAEAPTSIVHDATSPTDPVIRNGVSCMGCHGMDGIKPKADEVRDAVARAGADADRVRAVEALYAGGSELREAALGDAARYQRALSEILPTAGGSRVALSPVVSVARRFGAPLDAPALAAALDLAQDDLARRVAASAGALRRVAGPVLGGATLARDQFDCAWPDIAAEARPDWQVAPRSLVASQRCGGAQATARAAPPACAPQWHQVRSFNAALTESAWERGAACERARAAVRTRVEAVCSAAGTTAGSLDGVTCDCAQRYAAQAGRSFWACTTAGVVACGRYEQRCIGAP